MSADGLEGSENEPPSKKARVNAAQNAEASATEGAVKKRGRKKVRSCRVKVVDVEEGYDQL